MIDISNPQLEAHVRAVERILAELGLDTITAIRVLNKQDRVDAVTRTRLTRSLDGVPVSATRRRSLRALIARMTAELSVAERAAPEIPAAADYD